MGNKQENMRRQAQRIIKERDNQIRLLIPVLEKYLYRNGFNQQKILQIASLTAFQLVQLLNEGKIKSEDLVYVFTYRAVTEGMKLNLITQVNFEDALKLAVDCDCERRNSNKKNWTIEDQWDMVKFLPPLFGIPISVKDIFDMKGKRSTIGITNRIFDIKQRDAFIITCFKNSGMIPFVRTNVPQLAMIFDCNNFLWGRSLNVWNTNRSVGGSSGGEGGLLAARCSPIGIGSDIAGSLRIPAAFCGVYSLKPGETRLANCQTNFCLSQSGKQTITPTLGPICNSIQDLVLWMKTVCHEDFYAGQLDPYYKLHPFNEQVCLKTYKQQKLKIGYIKNLNLIQSSPSYQRAILQIKDLLSTLGHQVEQIRLPYEDQLIKQFYVQVSAEGRSRSYLNMLQGENIIPEYKQIVQISLLPNLVRGLIKNLMRLFQPRVGMLMDHIKEITVYEYFTHVGKVKQYRNEIVNFWKENQFDFIICPGFACPANRHGLSKNITLAAAYTFIWNMLLLPVGSMPVTTVRNDQQTYQSKYNDMITSTLKQNVRGSIGLPISIQIVGLPFHEERILGVMKIIDEWTKFNENHQPVLRE